MERKGEKRNLYQDGRDADKEKDEEERKKDDMVDWDEGMNDRLSRNLVLENHPRPRVPGVKSKADWEL